MRRILFICVLVACGCGAQTSGLHSTEIPFHRGLPHAYYDQAVASIEALHPGHEALVHVRFIEVGNRTVSVYAYSQIAGDEHVHVDGCVVEAGIARVVCGDTSRASLARTLKLAFGTDFAAASINSVQPTAARCAVSGG
jgi:hypothetical protein